LQKGLFSQADYWNELPDAIHILYVDDEPGLLDIGKMFLEKSGDFSVTTIGSATAAPGLHIKEEFDATISDYQIPGMDGAQFAEHTHKHISTVDHRHYHPGG